MVNAEKAECQKCYMCSMFINNCISSKNTKPNFLKGMLQMNYECCGQKFEPEFRAFVIETFEDYSRYFLTHCTLDKKGYVECMNLGIMMEYMTTENFDLNRFFNLEDCGDSDSD